MGDLWVKEREPNMTEMEWQCRNWLYFTWLSGDHIVEQHVHNLDVINWAMGTMPKNVMGMGGRQVRVARSSATSSTTSPSSTSTRTACASSACAGRPREAPTASRSGSSAREGVAWSEGKITGEKPWTFEGEETNPYVQEHIDLIASIRNGKPLNEGRQIAESTMCAIIGRMSAYTGRAISWEWAMNASKLDLTPPKYEFGPNPVDPAAVPGVTELV